MLFPGFSKFALSHSTLCRYTEDRNKIEKLAIATLEHLPTCVVFVTDLSGLCGTSVGRRTLTPPDPYGPVAERRLVSTLAPIK
jgi:hypothetical protein